ncbi:pilin [Undibacterium parvum]|nr:pilin [Undibacterium parvum]
MKKQQAFTLIEMMAVVAIIAILAAISVPSYLFKITREQIEAGISLADLVKKPVAASWLATQNFPTDNAAAGLPASDKIVNNYVSAISLENGAIHISFGNRATGPLKGKVLSLRPAVVDDAAIVPVTWVCAGAEAPDKMSIKGVDKTTVKLEHLPAACRIQNKK